MHKHKNLTYVAHEATYPLVDIGEWLRGDLRDRTFGLISENASRQSIQLLGDVLMATNEVNASIDTDKVLNEE